MVLNRFFESFDNNLQSERKDVNGFRIKSDYVPMIRFCSKGITLELDFLRCYDSV